MVYLRARWYAPPDGRFISRDLWDGDHNRPLSYNAWLYTYGNPINWTDPSGYITIQEAPAADFAVEVLQTINSVRIQKDWGYLVPRVIPKQLQSMRSCKWQEGEWSLPEIKMILDEVALLTNGMGGHNQFITNFGSLDIIQGDTHGAGGLTWPHRIMFTDSEQSFSNWIVMHELAHAWDANFNWKLSQYLETNTGGYTNFIFSGIKKAIGNCDVENRFPGCNAAGYYYGGKAPKGSDNNFNRREDFAESVTAYFHKEEAEQWISKYKGTIYKGNLYYSDYTKTLRWHFVDKLLKRKIDI